MNKILIFLATFFLLCGQGMNAQNIPNQGFEDWISAGGYDDPEGWVTLNVLSSALWGGNPVSVFQTTGVDAYEGTYALKLETIVLTSNPFPGTIPDTAGAVFTGSLVGTNLVQGYSYAGNPDTLSLRFKYFPMPGDTGGVFVSFTRRDQSLDSTIVLGTGYMSIDSTTNNFELGKVAIDWTSAGVPDTANITIISSAATPFVEGSYIIVDALQYGDAAPTVSQIESDTLQYDVFFVSGAVEISDQVYAWNDSMMLNGASVKIVSNYLSTEDSLSFTPQFGITGAFTVSTGVLQLTGAATFDEYTQVLRSVKYKNYASTPTSSLRKVEYTTNDLFNNSNVGFRFVNVLNSTGILDKHVSRLLSVFPSPSNTVVQVSGIPSEATSLEVVDLLGKVRMVSRVNFNSENLQLSDLESGSYFVRVYNTQGKQIANARFVVSK